MKLDKIRLATPEEIESIKDKADLTPTSRVLAMGEQLAVWRIANELDPVFYNGASDAKKYWFIWGLENILRGAGATEFYFNVSNMDHDYRKIVEHFGAEPTNVEPEIRYKKVL